MPSLFLLAIGLTAMALGSWKEHSAAQIMMQVTLACVGCLTLIWVAEAQYEGAIRYWCQAMFAATVTIPMLARRLVKTGMPRAAAGWGKKTCEAVFFSYLTIMLVTTGGLFQLAVYEVAASIPVVRSIAAPSTPPTAAPAATPALPPRLLPPVTRGLGRCRGSSGPPGLDRSPQPLLKRDQGR